MNQPQAQSKATQQPSSQQALKAAHSTSAGTARPTHAEIAKRAYEIYLKTGRKQGHCERNWLQAEQELRAQAMDDSGSKPAGLKSNLTNSYSSGSR